MNLKKALATICVLALGYNFAQAQFADFLNYPLTVTPHESADSQEGIFGDICLAVILQKPMPIHSEEEHPIQ